MVSRGEALVWAPEPVDAAQVPDGRLAEWVMVWMDARGRLMELEHQLQGVQGLESLAVVVLGLGVEPMDVCLRVVEWMDAKVRRSRGSGEVMEPMAVPLEAWKHRAAVQRLVAAMALLVLLKRNLDAEQAVHRARLVL